jgi:hypothetical protein
MAVQNPFSSSYRVEVSGWDLSENFFVEKTLLEWTEPSQKSVYVRHPLRPGAIVFVRLIDPTAGSHAFPIAYQAQTIRPADYQGMNQILLVQLRSQSAAIPSEGHGGEREEGQQAAVHQQSDYPESSK